METRSEAKQTGMAFLSIILSVAGCVLGYFVQIGSDSFGVGAVVAFAAVLTSLMSVKDKGHNLLAKIAFFFSVAALFLAVWLGVVK